MKNNQSSDTSAYEWLKAHAFKPGQSGNPKGRPPGILDRRTIVKALLDADDEETGLPNGVVMTAEQVRKAKKGDLASWYALMDSGHGKVPEKSELSGPNGGPIKTEANLADLDRQMLEQYISQKTKGE